MVDLFSGGGGGWCLAARALGLDAVGIEWDGPACATRAAVGLRTIRADVPWQAPYVARQIGNALPPPLAEACLRAVVAP